MKATNIIADPHQVEFAEKIWKVLQKFGYVYLARQTQVWEDAHQYTVC